jgi:hypothetical protein
MACTEDRTVLVLYSRTFHAAYTYTHTYRTYIWSTYSDANRPGCAPLVLSFREGKLFITDGVRMGAYLPRSLLRSLYTSRDYVSERVDCSPFLSYLRGMKKTKKKMRRGNVESCRLPANSP